MCVNKSLGVQYLDKGMPRPKNQIVVQAVESASIRHRYDEKTNKWFFSVVDLVDLVTGSSDPRNYWKVLKNRLKKEQNQLVTKINQLKLPSKDGKEYLTDVADTEVVLELLEILSPGNISLFRDYFTDFLYCPPDRGAEAPVGEEAELLVDGYETDTHIIVQAFIAGVALGDIYILPAREKLTIRGKRLPQEFVRKENYLYQELLWSRFARSITLPKDVDTDSIETTEENGMLTIRIKKLLN